MFILLAVVAPVTPGSSESGRMDQYVPVPNPQFPPYTPAPETRNFTFHSSLEFPGIFLRFCFCDCLSYFWFLGVSSYPNGQQMTPIQASPSLPGLIFICYS